tara:strand:- start:1547 stop:1831 length:285 start_codon:yes stop_codon:yes gene_type:complete
MTIENFNYQRIYEEELPGTIKDSLEMPDRFYELSHQQRMLVEELVNYGYRAAIEEALDPEILEETMNLSAEVGAQLYNFANMLSVHFSTKEGGE